MVGHGEGDVPSHSWVFLHDDGPCVVEDLETILDWRGVVKTAHDSHMTCHMIHHMTVLLSRTYLPIFMSQEAEQALKHLLGVELPGLNK